MAPEPVEPEKDEFEILDNEPELERPRLSLPLEEVDEVDEEPEMRPPRLSLAIEEDDITVEYPRRAANELERGRLSMMGPRLSENFGDATRLDSDDEDDEGDTGLVHGDDAGDEADETIDSQGAFDRGWVKPLSCGASFYIADMSHAGETPRTWADSTSSSIFHRRQPRESAIWTRTHRCTMMRDLSFHQWICLSIWTLGLAMTMMSVVCLMLAETLAWNSRPGNLSQ